VYKLGRSDVARVELLFTVICGDASGGIHDLSNCVCGARERERKEKGGGERAREREKERER